MEEAAFKINIEAANSLVRQIRLRNLSGIIIVDFIDMQKRTSSKLLQHLRAAVKSDKIQTVVVGMTSLGLVEITRKKSICLCLIIIAIRIIFCHLHESSHLINIPYRFHPSSI